MKVYLIKNAEEPYYKIGYTSRNVKHRLEELQTASPVKLEVIHTHETSHATLLESSLHRHFSPYRMEGEWFHLDDSQVELFADICDKIDRNISFLKEQSTYA